MADSLSNQSDVFNTSDNYSATGGPSVHDIIRSRIETQSAIYGIVLTILTIVVNSIVINSCLKDPVKRADTFYMQIVNFSVSNIFVSVFVLPFTVYFILQPWYLGHVLCTLWVVLDILIPFTSLTILLILIIDRILIISHPTAYTYLFKKCSTLIILMPWIIGLVIVVPVWTLGTLPYENFPGECIVIVNTEAALLCHILTYYIPVITLVILNLDMLVLKWKHSSVMKKMKPTEEVVLENKSVSPVTHGASKKQISHVRDANMNKNRKKDVPTCTVASMCAVSFVFAGMWFPFQCVSILLTLCDTQMCLPTAEFSQVVTWMGASSAAVAPLFFVIDNKFRNHTTRDGYAQTLTKHVGYSSTSEETFV